MTFELVFECSESSGDACKVVMMNDTKLPLSWHRSNILLMQALLNA